jgi:hypothetical protein
MRDHHAQTHDNNLPYLATDSGDDPHRPAAARTHEGIYLIDLADQARPSRLSSTQAGSARLQECLSAFIGGWGRRLGAPEEPVLLPIAPRAMEYASPQG